MPCILEQSTVLTDGNIVHSMDAMLTGARGAALLLARAGGRDAIADDWHPAYAVAYGDVNIPC